MSNARTNNASSARINKSAIFASGTFKNVWAGTYTDGTRTGQRYVAKEFKSSSVYEDEYFDEEMNIIRRTQSIIDAFDATGIIGGRKILLNRPEVWTCRETGQKFLIEPMIENFEKFNSNTGWATITGAEWGEAI